MKGHLKHVYYHFSHIPLLGKYAYGARVSYLSYKRLERFGSGATPELLWSAFWNTSKYCIRNTRNTPLIVRKALAFQLVLEWLERRVANRGIGVLLGNDIPHWYPYFTTPMEETLTEVSNLTPGFDYVLEMGLSGILTVVQGLEDTPTKEAFVIILESVKAFCDNIAELPATKNFETIDGVTAEDIRRWIARVPWDQPSNFEEAVFAVWFLHLLCWYDNHKLIGLGRLDQWLWPYLKWDLEHGRITEAQALDVIKNLIEWLNGSRLRKSNLLLGDTGQTLIIGGLDGNGRDSTNSLSILFIKALEELKLPEPKLVARVSSASDDEYLMKLAELVRANLGHPLFCNDELIVAALIKEGYSEEDARDYGVAACWEYLIPGRSFDQGNTGIISFLTIISNTIRIAINQNIKDFNDFMKIYENQLILLIHEKVKTANSLSFIPAPFLSIMYPDCLRSGKDITEGGAQYNNYGLLGMGLADATDSLCVIKKAVFEDKILSLEQLELLLRQDFNSDEKIRQFFIHRFPKFGNDEEYADEIATQIVNIFAYWTRQQSTPYGGIFRPGLGSAGEYIYTAKDIPATPNGRKSGAPCAVNLSPSLGAPRLGPTAILKSMTKPDLEQMSNCAVTEVSINISLMNPEIEAEQQWIKWLLQAFILLGGAELQFNVMDAKMLREAQKHPEQYRDLLVRVWGFNAYFVDLPREFQDHIIARVESCAI